MITFKAVNLHLLHIERKRSPKAKRQVAAGDMAEIQKAHCQILWSIIEGEGIDGVVDVLKYLKQYGRVKR